MKSLVVAALSKIYANRDPPISFLTDSGKEFVGKLTQNWFKDRNIQFHETSQNCSSFGHFSKYLHSKIQPFIDNDT